MLVLYKTPPGKPGGGSAHRSCNLHRLLFAAAVFFVPAPPGRTVIAVIADAVPVLIPVISPAAVVGRENDIGGCRRVDGRGREGPCASRQERRQHDAREGNSNLCHDVPLPLFYTRKSARGLLLGFAALDAPTANATREVRMALHEGAAVRFQHVTAVFMRVFDALTGLRVHIITSPPVRGHGGKLRIKCVR
jgi:hypothetical protein